MISLSLQPVGRCRKPLRRLVQKFSAEFLYGGLPGTVWHYALKKYRAALSFTRTAGIFIFGTRDAWRKAGDEALVYLQSGTFAYDADCMMRS